MIRDIYPRAEEGVGVTVLPPTSTQCLTYGSRILVEGFEQKVLKKQLEKLDLARKLLAEKPHDTVQHKKLLKLTSQDYKDILA